MEHYLIIDNYMVYRRQTMRGIVDEVITMAEVVNPQGQLVRAFICQTLNNWSFPAKDRSGRLAMVETAHLGALMGKIIGPAPVARPGSPL